MTTFGKKSIAGLALAVASVTALAACSSSGSGSASPTSSATPGVTTQPGSIGGIPGAGTPTGKAATFTYGYLAADAPNWILPIIPAADNSVYNSFVFQWQMWRPTWFTWNGSSPAVDSALSPANAPVSSNGGKTMTITFKPWKWSDGQTVGAADMAFTLDEIKAALKESPANWANYVPGYFPDTLTSM
jgi:peptide/nickel transport system substrate-binding protein